MIVEMRTYRTKSGMRASFLELFRVHTIPEHHRLGMAIMGPFLSVEDDDTFFFMRSSRPRISPGDEGEVLRRQVVERCIGSFANANVRPLRCRDGL